MLRNMSSSSVESLGELPQPYDISSAVSKALRIHSSSAESSSEVSARGAGHVLPLTANETSTASNTLRARAKSCCDDYQSRFYSDPRVHYYDTDFQMEMEIADSTISAICNTFEDPLSAASSITELEHFCTFLDNSRDLEDQDVISTPEKTPPTRVMPCAHPSSLGASSKRRKSKRSLSFYEESSSSPEPSPAALACLSGPARNFGWVASLANAEIWRKFDRVGTEMVITKTGRRIFPTLNLTVDGLDPNAVYSVKLNISPSNSKRYKYIDSKWVHSGKAEKKTNYCEYAHPDSPNTGSFWLSKGVSFKHVKLTNNKNTKYYDQIILNSMQKYQPIVTVTSEGDGVCQKFYFPETQFIAVTCYQNSKITQMKIDHNPYARAFREGSDVQQKGGHRICKESHNSTSPVHIKESTTTSSTRTSEGTELASSIGSEEVDYYTVDIVPLANPFSSSSLNYWADDNSLWNPNLIAPHTNFDSTSSFSEPYLQQTSWMMAQNDISPVKALCGSTPLVEDSFVDVENIDNDDVFM